MGNAFPCGRATVSSYPFKRGIPPQRPLSSQSADGVFRDGLTAGRVASCARHGAFRDVQIKDPSPLRRGPDQPL